MAALNTQFRKFRRREREAARARERNLSRFSAPDAADFHYYAILPYYCQEDAAPSLLLLLLQYKTARNYPVCMVRVL